MRIREMKSYPIQKLLVLVILFATHTAGQNLLAVMDLVSDGSISKSTLVAISDKISQSVKDSSYSQFDRSTLPELFNYFNMNDSSLSCYDPQCLILLGKLIGANAIIGGFVSHKKDVTEIKLNLVDVVNKNTLNTVSIRSSSTKTVFLQTEIPQMVKTLFSPKNEQIAQTNNEALQASLVESSPSKKTQTNNTNGSLKPHETKNHHHAVIWGTVGLGVVGGAAAAYFGLMNNVHSGNGESPLSMDDAPVRERK